jgi:hypothetical protein
MKYIISILALFSISAFAAEPAYWMKSYPNAPQAKVDQCLIVAQEVYEKAHRGGMDGHFVGVLHKGLAWEKCMESS